MVPKTNNQELALRSYFAGSSCAFLGSAGTGKTYLALYLAFKELLTNDMPVVIVRSAVPVRSIGHLPGTVEEKLLAYEAPYISIATSLFNHSSAWSNLKRLHGCSFIPTSFIRGVTLDNCTVVVDEAENMTFQELDSIVTRLGVNSRLIICGDSRQADIRDSGLDRIISILAPLIAVTEFQPSDIVRSSFVRDYIIRRDSL